MAVLVLVCPGSQNNPAGYLASSYRLFCRTGKTAVMPLAQGRPLSRPLNRSPGEWSPNSLALRRALAAACVSPLRRQGACQITIGPAKKRLGTL